MNIPFPDSRVMKRGEEIPMPVYTDAGRAGVTVRFGGDASLKIAANRERAYPGLASESPPTFGFYERALRAFAGERRVIDLGCGAGAGTRLLSLNVPEAIGVDRSAVAVSFAKNLAPRAKVLVSDVTMPIPVGAVDAAVMIDLLGHVASPENVLIAARGVLPLGKRIYIAEASAFRAQYLTPPARRAFSQRGLASLLAQCGYEVVSWEVTEGPFLACIATPFTDASWELLRRGAQRLGHGEIALAAQDFATARASGRPAIALEACLGEAAAALVERAGDRAIQALFDGRKIDADDPRPLSELARVALAMGDVSEASQLATTAERLDPTDVGTVCTTALIAERARPDVAKGLWLTASNLVPDSLDVALRLTQIAAAEEDYDLALWALERVRAYGDEHGVVIHTALASALLGAGRQADAVLEAELAQKLAPKDEGIAELLAQIRDAKR